MTILSGVLDIGSCYNPLSRGKFSSDLDLIAIDLHPADPSVYKANFFDIKIGQVSLLVCGIVHFSKYFLYEFILYNRKDPILYITLIKQHY
jgi:hypothetical protein